MRIAWFSPFPPVRTGIADCSAELVAALRSRGHAIDPYPTEAAHDFPWTHRQRPYDLVVYQFGNSSHHDYAWAYALRYPGLVVLHDTHLHHARAAFLLREGRADDYRAEFAWNHPDVPAAAAELAVHGFNSHLLYAWPMVRSLIAAARLTAVHGEGAKTALIASTPNATTDLVDRIVSIRLGHGTLVTPEDKVAARARILERHGLSSDAVLFGCFGGLTPEKRIPQILAALRAILPYAPSAHLILAGAPAAHYDVQRDIAAQALQSRVTITGYLEESDLTAHLAACDVSLNLRWPTVGETSGSWLRALAAGVATVITDLVHTADVPSLDPRTWTPASSLQPPASSSQPPVCVAIDILDEDHSLRLAMRRLARDAALRDQLGRAGRAWWMREHSLAVMVEDYERVMREAAARPAETPDEAGGAPPHLRDAGDRRVGALLAPFGIDAPL